MTMICFRHKSHQSYVFRSTTKRFPFVALQGRPLQQPEPSAPAAREPQPKAREPESTKAGEVVEAENPSGRPQVLETCHFSLAIFWGHLVPANRRDHSICSKNAIIAKKIEKVGFCQMVFKCF